MFTDDPELTAEFVTEAREHLEVVESNLLALETEQGDPLPVLNLIFRAMHSIKGAAGMLGFNVLRDLTHAAETILARLRSGEQASSPAIVSALLVAADRTREILDDLANEPNCNIDVALARLAAMEPSPDGADKQAPAANHAPAPSPASSSDSDSDSDEEADEDAEADTDGTDVAVVATPEPPQGNAAPAPANANVMALRKPPAGETKSAPGAQNAAAIAAHNETVRVPVWVLDRLMALTGELVLVRNRTLQHLEEQLRQDRSLAGSVDRRLSQQLDLVTSDLQEAVLRTRMQPVGKVFGKIPRLCRDLAAKLGKEIACTSVGDDVEVDKTILECLSDPLVHLIRNACDHGLETPDERLQVGKPRSGTVHISARHDAGQIEIAIRDDGRGVDPKKIAAKAISVGLCRPDELAAMTSKQICSLIFAPGFSTAAVVGDVSGRGVGMDVVKTSIEGIGGSLELVSEVGKGSTFFLRVPLTLAIVSSLVVRTGGKLFAIPQVNLEEIVRLDGDEIVEGIEYINSQPIYRLRDSLLPLVYLEDVLKHRDKIPDSALEQRARDAGLVQEHAGKILTFAVVRVSDLRFGIVVDKAIGSEEIVVKPNHPLLNDLRCFVGSTILGDGSVALIVDVNGVAQHASVDSRLTEAHDTGEPSAPRDMQRDLLITISGEDRFLVTLGLVARVVPISRKSLHHFGNVTTVEVDGTSVRVVMIDKHLGTSPYPADRDDFLLILPRHFHHAVGFLATGVIDIYEGAPPGGTDLFEHEAVLGSCVIDNHQALYLDLFALARLEQPERYINAAGSDAQGRRVLLVDDVEFFRKAVGRYLAELGLEVETAVDGMDALDKLQRAGAPFDLLVSDIEMPRMDGFGLIQAVRASKRPDVAKVPALALSALPAPEARDKAISMGFNEFELKLEKTKLCQAIAAVTGWTKIGVAA